MARPAPAIGRRRPTGGRRALASRARQRRRRPQIAAVAKHGRFASNEAEQEQLTAVRQKQNAAWAAESAEVKQALSALQDPLVL